jgi:hypothetical protein
MIPVFERSKTVRALDCAAIGDGFPYTFTWQMFDQNVFWFNPTGLLFEISSKYLPYTEQFLRFKNVTYV